MPDELKSSINVPRLRFAQLFQLLVGGKDQVPSVFYSNVRLEEAGWEAIVSFYIEAIKFVYCLSCIFYIVALLKGLSHAIVGNFI